MPRLLALASLAALASCATTGAVAPSFRDVAPAPAPALAASPPCADAAQLLDAFHGGLLKAPLAAVAARAGEVLAKCPRAWEAHEVAGWLARLQGHDDDATTHFMAAAADLRTKDARFFLAEMRADDDAPVSLERAELAFLTDVAAHHPDPAVRADAAVRRVDLAALFDERDDHALDGLGVVGVVGAWRVAGAFDNDQGKGFLTPYPPEAGVDVDVDEEMKGRLLPVHWRKVERLRRDGSVPLDDVVAPARQSVAYLVTWAHSDVARGARLVLSTNAPFRVFVNGRLAGEEQKVDRLGVDAFSLPIDLAAGGNEILVKSAHESGSWGLRARLVDDTGAGAGGVTFSADPVRVARDARPPAPHVDVEPTAAGDGPRARLVRARTLERAGLVRAALEAARGYADASRTGALAVLVESALLERNQEAGKAIDLLNEAVGNDTAPPAALVVARARFYMAKRRWDAAQDDLRGVLSRDPAVRDAVSALATVFAHRTWHVDRCRLVDDGLARWPDDAALVRAKASCLRARERIDEAIAAWRRALALEPGSSTTLVQLAWEARLAGDAVESKHAFEKLAALDETRPAWLVELAKVAEAENDAAAARAWLEKARAMNPDAPEAWERLGDLAYEHGDKTRALTLWREALARNPDDSDLAFHVDFVADEGLGALKKYVPDRDRIQRAIAAARAKPAAPGANVVTVLDHDVTEVNTDGSARAVVTEVQMAVNQRGRDELLKMRIPRDARILDAHSITPKGEAQDASSINAGIIRFRQLDVGSITVVQYLDHLRPHGFLPNHYVATFWFSQPQHDVRDSTWIVITAKDRALVRHVHGGVKETVGDDGDRRVHTWRAVDVPPLVPEPRMPPMANLLWRVSVSTLDSWDEYARWEQALLKDAFRSNAELDALENKLLDGAGDKRDKINRLFRYVSKDIRYTQDYESTIAGVKPHACPVVLERGYGDCKDKAVLLISLLKKAGIDADFAILRTTDDGEVEKDVPNQQFNHAIVYVKKQPGIDEGFFTDPTTDALDLGNLRNDDQGAVSLVLEPDTGRWQFVDIPYQSPDLEYSRAVAVVDVARKTAHVDVSSRGAGASAERRAVRDAETAKKLEQGWATILWPGSTVLSGTVDTSEDLAKPFSLSIDVDVGAALHDDSDGVRVDVPHISPFADLTRLAERKLPLRLGIPSSESSDVTFTLAPGKKVLRAPTDFHVAYPCFRADRTTTTTPTSVRVRQSYEKTCPEIAAADYPAFRAKALEVVTHENDPLVLSK